MHIVESEAKTRYFLFCFIDLLCGFGGRTNIVYLASL
jgi:hypothetical protein